jgi:CBS domain containing-hemolysin-like protein
MLIMTILFFLMFTALFAGAEIAFISASKLRVELKREKGSRRGEILAQFYDKPEEFIGAMLVGLNITLVVLTYLMTQLLEPILQPFIEGEFWLFLVITFIITIIILVFGEFIPKILFHVYADVILFNLAYPLRAILWLIAPLTLVMTRIAKFLLRLFVKMPEEEEIVSFTSLDLENFIKNTRTESEESIDTELFGNALHLKDVKVRGCMIPRGEVVHVDVNDAVEDLMEIFKDTKMSKVIITDGDLDNIIGYVHHQKMLHRPKTIASVLMKIPIVHESMRVDVLMNTFSRQRASIACVVDEFGSTSGIIAMEDIMEQIFGDIEDEHDEENYTEIILSDHEFMFSGRLELDYINEKYGLSFPEGDFSTLSGYLVMTTGNIPEEQESVELEGYRFVMEAVSEKKIETVRVIRLVDDL